MDILAIKMDCCQTTITQIALNDKSATVKKTVSFLFYLGYKQIKKPEIYVSKIKSVLKQQFPAYRKNRLLLIVSPDFCEERFMRDPDVVQLAKEEGCSASDFILTDAGIGGMRLVTEQDTKEVDPLYLAFCRQGLIPHYVVSPLYAAWKLTQYIVPQKDNILIVNPAMQNISYSFIKDGSPTETHFGEASIAGFITKLMQQDIDEIKAMQMMLVFGVEPMELAEFGFDYKEYPFLLTGGTVSEVVSGKKEKKKKEKIEKPQKPQKPKKQKKEKKEKKNADVTEDDTTVIEQKKPKKEKRKALSAEIGDFSLDDLAMTDMQFEAFCSGIRRFSDELQSELSLYLEDIDDTIDGFLIASDLVVDLNMRVHDCANIAECILTVPSGMILKGCGIEICNESLEDLKTGQMLCIGAAVATYLDEEHELAEMDSEIGF